jgi:hypothetical protein
MSAIVYGTPTELRIIMTYNYKNYSYELLNYPP